MVKSSIFYILIITQNHDMKTLFLNDEIISNTSDESIRNRLEGLSLEAIAISNVIDVFRGILPDLTKKISETLDTLSFYKESNSPEIKDLLSDYKDLEKKLSLINYVEKKDLLISIPEGFKGNLVDYITLLESMSNKIYPEANKLLMSYKLILTGFLTSKDQKISLTDHTNFFNSIKRDREGFISTLSSFQTSNNASKARLTDSINKINDVDVLVKKTEIINKLRNNNSIKELVSTVSEISKLLDTIIDRVSKGDVNNISGASAKNLSEGAYEVAKYIEFVAIFNFKVEQITATTIKLVKQLSNEIK